MIATRAAVHAALRSAIPRSVASVHIGRRRPGTDRRGVPRIEVAAAGATEERDIVELSLTVTAGGHYSSAETAATIVADLVTDALPPYVASPVWEIAYDESDAVWIAAATVQAFREEATR